ncbi:hypothetical protein QYE76_056154 [Lolium multiflorum]|uniref:CCHC-type domain-containing protein n=1 Tax=Lolium multiflorum TaxID=4521 RepID=A0AAD8T2G4_LOLMU|nr:hypothetical protein QYE76_056154 [Lolium multiflorum]
MIKIFYALLQAASERLPQQQEPPLVGFGISSRSKLLQIYVVEMASPINFNQFLEKEKLKSNGSNFTDWFRHVRIFLSGGNLQYVLDAPLGDPPAETETDEVKAVYETRKTRYSQVQCAILCSLESDLQKRFEHHDPHELMNELKAIFETHAAVECYEASKHFFSCMMEEGSSVSEHMLAMTGHAKKLSDLGIVIPNRLGINRVLQSLPPSYKNFVMNYNMQNMNKELPELFGMLKAAEIEIKKEHQVLMVNKTTSFKKQGKSKGKFKKGGKKAATPPVKPKNGPKPDAECYYCKEKGHWKRNCSKYLADLKSGLVKKKKEDATIARSRQIENTETPNENAATPVNSPESVEYSSDDPDEDYVELDDDFIDKCNATTDARKIKKLLAQHTVRYKLSPDPKFATSPINIKDKYYDFSLDLSHIAIVEKTPFCGTEKESAVEHMNELSTLSSLFSDDVKMRTYFVAKIFPFSLKDDAKTWYNSLPPGSIDSPSDLLDVFFRKYFPASAQHIALQKIYSFDQEDGEKLPEAWARFCSLIRARPGHDLEKHDLLDIFYSGLTIESRAYLDSCAGCVFRKRTPDEAEELLAKIGRNHDDWTTPEPTPTPILKKRGLIKLNDEDMREAKKSLKEKGIKSEDVKNLPPIEDLCKIIPPSSMIEDPLYPEGHPKRVEQDSQRIEPSAPSKKKKKKHKNVVESSEPVNDPNSISISDAETESGNEHDNDNDKNDASDKEEVEDEPEKHAKNKKYTKEDFIAKKHGAVIDCNKGKVTFNVDDKEHTVYFPKRIDKVCGVNTISNVRTIKVGAIDCPIYEPKEGYQNIMIGSISIQFKVT